MSQEKCFEKRGDVAIVRIDNPPVNALTTGVPEGVAKAVGSACEDPGVRAIVVLGAGRTFAAGADINEFVRYAAGRGPMPQFHRWLNTIEDAMKPVVMAIHGQALGAGLELAMAGHYRVAVADAQLGQPEVKIGLIPGAGGTVRLPRLVGVEKAAEMCAFGEPLSAREAFEAGLVDRVIEGDLLDGAIVFAREIVRGDTTSEWNRDCEGADAELWKRAEGPQIRERSEGETRNREGAGNPIAAARGWERTRDLVVQGSTAGFGALRERCRKTRRNLEAPLAAIEAIERTAALNFEEGRRAEAEIFRRLLASTQCRALIHAFFAERAAAKVPGVTLGTAKDTRVYAVHRAGVIGAGTMGGGIAMALANAGIDVRLRDVSQEALDRGVATIRANYDRSVASGRMSAADRDARLARITAQLDDAGFSEADILIEAVFESLELKKDVFRWMDRVAKPECLLASNTSTLDIDALAAVTSRPERVLGTHFFSPANVMRLLEIVRGKTTASEAIATAMALAKAMKKVGVVVGNGFGFAGNRIVIPYMNQAEFLVEEGATPERVDRVLTDFGMAMGPFAVADLSGVDVFWRIRQEREHTPGERQALGVPLLYAAGRYGQKTGAGWYRYGPDRKPEPDPEVVAEVHRAARDRGIVQREIPDQEILDRCVFALVNEGARVLEEGIVTRASDIDVVYLTGYGFPVYRGGPMFYADTVGLPHVLARAREFGWEPPPLLEKLAREGRRFNEE